MKIEFDLSCVLLVHCLCTFIAHIPVNDVEWFCGYSVCFYHWGLKALCWIVSEFIM